MKIKTADNSIHKAAKVISAYYYESEFCEVKNWDYDFAAERTASKGYNDCFCIVFVRNGSFLFDISRDSYDLHNGYIVVDKPDYEYRLRPATGRCSIFNFKETFIQQFVADLNLRRSSFFKNENILSLLLKTTPEIEYLHHQVLKRCGHAGKLEIDQLILNMLKRVVLLFADASVREDLSPSLKKFHLKTIESSKQYLHDNFPDDISLHQVSSYACVSPFHFSRIFKQFTSYSPYQYLLNIRLQHSELLLQSSNLSVIQISHASGFNSAENFSTAFRQKYSMTPSQFRKESQR